LNEGYVVRQIFCLLRPLLSQRCTEWCNVWSFAWTGAWTVKVRRVGHLFHAVVIVWSWVMRSVVISGFLELLLELDG